MKGAFCDINKETSKSEAQEGPKGKTDQGYRLNPDTVLPEHS